MPPGDWAAGERGIASLPGREEEFRASVAKALDYARALGTERLHAMAGLLPAGADRARHRAVYVENLRYAARELAKEDRTLLIEPINTRDIPGFFLNTQDEAHAICEEVGEANLKVQMDFYHTQIVQGDVSHDPAKIFFRRRARSDRGRPGAARAGHRRIEQRLSHAACWTNSVTTGWVGCEYRPRGRTEDGLGWLKAWA